MVLQQMRSMKMFVFWFVAIVFIVGFVFLGGMDVPQVGKSDANTVAEVNGEKIPYEVYSRYVGQLAEFERSRFQRDELGVADYDRIEAQAWDGLLSEMLVRQEARRLRITVADEEIVGTLTQSPPTFVRQRFTDDKGQFDAAAFQAAINDPNYNWGPDESYLRSILPSLKLEKMVRARASIDEAQVREEWARRTLRTKVRYAGAAWSSVDLSAWVPSDAELGAFYDAHPERFSRGETVTLELIQVDRKPSTDDEQDALDEAQQVLDEEKKGDTFAQLAEIYSDDASAPRGGDLGWVTPQAMPPPVDGEAAKLEAGQTSPPVRTERGIYLVHADSVRFGPAGREMRLRQIVLVPKASGETIDSLRTRVLEAGETARSDFAAAARVLGVEVKKLEPVENYGFLPGVGFSKRLVEWAFEARPGDVSDPVGTDTAMLIARLVSRNPKAPRPFEEIRDQVKYAAQEQAKKDRARQRLERVLAALRAGTPFEAAVRAEGLALEDPAPCTYYESVPGIGSANEFAAVASSLPVGATSGVVETPSGAYVLQVVSRDVFDAARYQNERSADYRKLLQQREAEVYEAWLKELRDRATIEDRRRPRV